jgi:hypothetical protein
LQRWIRGIFPNRVNHIWVVVWKEPLKRPAGCQLLFTITIGIFAVAPTSQFTHTWADSDCDCVSVTPPLVCRLPPCLVRSKRGRQIQIRYLDEIHRILGGNDVTQRDGRVVHVSCLLLSVLIGVPRPCSPAEPTMVDQTRTSSGNVCR